MNRFLPGRFTFFLRADSSMSWVMICVRASPTSSMLPLVQTLVAASNLSNLFWSRNLVFHPEGGDGEMTSIYKIVNVVVITK